MEAIRIKTITLPCGKVLEFRHKPGRVEFSCYRNAKHRAKRWCYRGGTWLLQDDARR